MATCPLSENGPMRCHCMANQLSVLDHTGIGSIDPFASVTTPSTREFKARHIHSIPESYSEYHRQGLDFSDSQEWPSMGSNLYHEDTNNSDSSPVLDIQEISIQSKVERKWLSGTRS